MDFSAHPPIPKFIAIQPPNSKSESNSESTEFDSWHYTCVTDVVLNYTLGPLFYDEYNWFNDLYAKYWISWDHFYTHGPLIVYWEPDIQGPNLEGVFSLSYPVPLLWMDPVSLIGYPSRKLPGSKHDRQTAEPSYIGYLKDYANIKRWYLISFQHFKIWWYILGDHDEPLSDHYFKDISEELHFLLDQPMLNAMLPSPVSDELEVQALLDTTAMEISDVSVGGEELVLEESEHSSSESIEYFQSVVDIETGLEGNVQHLVVITTSLEVDVQQSAGIATKLEADAQQSAVIETSLDFDDQKLAVIETNTEFDIQQSTTITTDLEVDAEQQIDMTTSLESDAQHTVDMETDIEISTQQIVDRESPRVVHRFIHSTEPLPSDFFPQWVQVPTNPPSLMMTPAGSQSDSEHWDFGDENNNPNERLLGLLNPTRRIEDMSDRELLNLFLELAYSEFYSDQLLFF